MSTCERLARPLDVQARDVWQIAKERWPLILADLATVPTPLVVEGECLLPSTLATHGVDPSDVTFLFITPAERRLRYATREWAREMVTDCPNPAAALDVWMARDDLTEVRLREEALASGFDRSSVRLPNP